MTLSEVVESNAPHRYVRKIMNVAVPLLEAHIIEEIPGGSSYTARIGTRVPTGTARRLRDATETELRDQIAKVKALVESGWRHPDVA